MSKIKQPEATATETVAVIDMGRIESYDPSAAEYFSQIQIVPGTFWLTGLWPQKFKPSRRPGKPFLKTGLA